jgi:S-adenosylmethionine synthetase
MPDAKSQVSVIYDGKTPVGIHTVLMSVAHASDVEHSEIEKTITKNVIEPVLKEFQDKLATINPKFSIGGARYLVNPSGRFTIWGSFSDSGCVGRKIVVDTYGGVGRVGGGCFSSKNATKVDRSGAYYARYAAKNVVAAGLADECEIQAAYAIGVAKPISIAVETFGRNKVPHEQIVKYVEDNFDFSPSNIISELDLLKPVFKHTACYGHFGREEFSWERVKKI